jgi:hypothetical protein
MLILFGLANRFSNQIQIEFKVNISLLIKKSTTLGELQKSISLH